VQTPAKNLILIFICLMTVIFISGCHAVYSFSSAMPPEPSSSKQESAWWTPEPGLSWQIQYVGEIDLDVDVEVYNLDLFETSAEDIAYLHARGVKVICYLNAGAWEDWRPDRDDFPEGVLGNDYEGWSGERWLDIRRIDLLGAVMIARLDLCAQKGFDGVDPDNLDGYQNQTGFPLTADDQLAYNRWLAEEAHKRSLAIGLKNDSDQVQDLVVNFDWVITESCFAEGWCDQVVPFIEENKPVFAIEYTDNGMRLEDFCNQAAALSIDAILKQRNLDAWRKTCP